MHGNCGPWNKLVRKANQRLKCCCNVELITAGKQFCLRGMQASTLSSEWKNLRLYRIGGSPHFKGCNVWLFIENAIHTCAERLLKQGVCIFEILNGMFHCVGFSSTSKQKKEVGCELLFFISQECLEWDILHLLRTQCAVSYCPKEDNLGSV